MIWLYIYKFKRTKIEEIMRLLVKGNETLKKEEAEQEK